MLPLDDEVKALQAFKGDPTTLIRPERFMLKVFSVKRVRHRVRILLFIRQFDENFEDLQESWLIMENACKEVQSSAELKKLLSVALSVGNLVNDGTARGNAAGFRINGLAKAADVKGDASIAPGNIKELKGLKTITLLHAIVYIAQSSKGYDITKLSSEVATVQEATQILSSELSALVSKLDSGLALVNTELMIAQDGSSKDSTTDEYDKILHKELSDFLKKATEKREILGILASHLDCRFLYTYRCQISQWCMTLAFFCRWSDIFNKAAGFQFRFLLC